ncbi:MAG: hypothetical protein Q9209_002434 [Squamulea sp. 1 TL-2023]
MFSKHTWCVTIGEMEIGSGRIKLMDLGREYTGEIWKIYHGQRPKSVITYFVPFPQNLLRGVERQEAVLSQNCCRHAVHLVDVLIRDMLKDMNAKIREVSLRVKNERLMLVGLPQGSNPIAPSAQHVIFRITLPSEECHVIDLTASQYGWHGPATMSWDTFVAERLDTIEDECGLGETKHALRGDIDANDLVRKQHQSVLDCVKKGFDHNLGVWQQQNMSLKALARCPEEEYTINQALLLIFMEKKISEICAEVDRKYVAETLSA